MLLRREHPEDGPPTFGALAKWWDGGGVRRVGEEAELSGQVRPYELKCKRLPFQLHGAPFEVDGYRVLGATAGVEDTGPPATSDRVAADLRVYPKSNPFRRD